MLPHLCDVVSQHHLRRVIINARKHRWTDVPVGFKFDVQLPDHVEFTIVWTRELVRRLGKSRVCEEVVMALFPYLSDKDLLCDFTGDLLGEAAYSAEVFGMLLGRFEQMESAKWTDWNEDGWDEDGFESELFERSDGIRSPNRSIRPVYSNRSPSAAEVGAHCAASIIIP